MPYIEEINGRADARGWRRVVRAARGAYIASQPGPVGRGLYQQAWGSTWILH
jgi:hypothetical protein